MHKICPLKYSSKSPFATAFYIPVRFPVLALMQQVSAMALISMAVRGWSAV